MTLNELKLEIADILEEAKKKKIKADDLKKKGAAVEAYGTHDEAFDFSAPLDGMNLYKQQGGVNWGPYTNGGTTVDSAFENPNTGPKSVQETALRAVVRDVIKNGLIPEHSAWAPLLKKEDVSEGTWGDAMHMFEAWYSTAGRCGWGAKPLDYAQLAKKPGEKKAVGIEKTKYSDVKKHGQEKKKVKKK